MTSTADISQNFLQASNLVHQAVSKFSAQLVCLPECFAFIGENFKQSLAMAEDLSGPIIADYKGLAKKHGVWLSLGGFQKKVQSAADGEAVSATQMLRNTHLIVSPEGEIVSEYAKMHLFDVDVPNGPSLRESAFTQAGEEVVVSQTSFGNLGLSICYDVRFPELYSALRLGGAELILVPALFTVPTGAAHWEVLLRARAIETQCYVLAAAQVGRHNVKRESYGNAMIVDPWGTVIARVAGDSIGLAVAELDLDRLGTIRRSMPCLNHRKPQLSKFTVSATATEEAKAQSNL
eukprot:TRINITY_DN8449_c0_g1_i2.p1 TRINITY_DN8449_c0_g1~~TRINITY_DN8449_c0_g1_i2.p1  ORF type:complete len:310 (-),score=65.00 TRINITY_DN8449_c0_g1_i2:113-988(-)